MDYSFETYRLIAFLAAFILFSGATYLVDKYEDKIARFIKGKERRFGRRL